MNNNSYQDIEDDAGQGQASQNNASSIKVA